MSVCIPGRINYRPSYEIFVVGIKSASAKISFLALTLALLNLGRILPTLIVQMGKELSKRQGWEKEGGRQQDYGQWEGTDIRVRGSGMGMGGRSGWHLQVISHIRSTSWVWGGQPIVNNTVCGAESPKLLDPTGDLESPVI